MVTITCYGGVGEIGGNQVLLEDGDTRLFFDFGTPYGRWGRYYEEYLKPRPGAGLLDPMVMGLLPPIQGLYRPDLELYAPNLWERAKRRAGYRSLEGADGVLVTHAHLDHSGYVSFLHPEIPVYSSAMTAFIAKAIQDTTGADFEKEVCYFRRRELTEGGVLATGDSLLQRPFALVDSSGLSDKARAFWNRSPVKKSELTPAAYDPPSGQVGALPIHHFSVDHSIYGARVYAVETSAGWVAFTGDMRLNWEEERTRKLVEGLAALRLRILICEGTRAGDASPPVTEAEVAQRALEAARETGGLIIADFGPRNVHRLKTFLQVAQTLGRKLVITAKDAYLLEAMALLETDTPTVQHPDVLVYQELKSRPPTWEQELRDRYFEDVIGPRELRANLEHFVLCFSFWDMKELVDLDPRGGLYIYSSSEAYNEEQQADLRRLKNWLDHFGIRHVGLPLEVRDHFFEVPEGEKGLHASGHSSGADLVRFIKEVRPRGLIPVHVRCERRLDGQVEFDGQAWFRDQLSGAGIEVRIPQYGEPMLIA